MSEPIDKTCDAIPKNTKWLYIYNSIIIEKDQIKECRIENMAGDRYNVSYKTTDGKSNYIIPSGVSWGHAADVLSDIRKQLDN